MPCLLLQGRRENLCVNLLVVTRYSDKFIVIVIQSDIMHVVKRVRLVLVSWWTKIHTYAGNIRKVCDIRYVGVDKPRTHTHTHTHTCRPYTNTCNPTSILSLCKSPVAATNSQCQCLCQPWIYIGLRSSHSVHNVHDRGLLRAMWEELAGKVGHRDL